MTERARSVEKAHAVPHAFVLNPCPVCGAETALAEIEPHPVHVNLEIHGSIWRFMDTNHRCGSVKSLVVSRLPRPTLFH